MSESLESIAFRPVVLLTLLISIMQLTYLSQSPQTDCLAAIGIEPLVSLLISVLCLPHHLRHSFQYQAVSKLLGERNSPRLPMEHFFNLSRTHVT